MPYRGSAEPYDKKGDGCQDGHGLSSVYGFHELRYLLVASIEVELVDMTRPRL